MRILAKAVLAALCLACTAWPGLGLAQEETVAAAPKPAAAGTVNPTGPIPYTVYKKKFTPPARPKAAVRTASEATTPATPTGVLPLLPASPTGSRLLPGEPLPPAELESYVDGVVKEALAREHIAGVVVSVVQNGQVIFKKGYGFAGLNPQRRADPDRSLFRIGSISKTFTWIALMKEVEAGRIRINAPINLYLPERQQVRDQGYSEPIRVANLMDHSAGFEDRALGHVIERKYSRERSLAEYVRQERPRRVHAPGAISSYSNYGADLAGLAVSYVSDKTFERVIEDEIIVPLGLAHTTFRENHEPKAGMPAPMPARLVGDIARGYRWTPTGFEPRPYEFIGHSAPAGSASSTAADMARYMLMLLGGGTLEGVTIYSPRTAQDFRTPQRQTPPGINGWAHGFVVYDLPGSHRGFGHDGATLSFTANMVVAPDLNLGVFVAANTETGQSLTNRLPARIVQQFYVPVRAFPRPGSPALQEAQAVYAGHYVGSRRAYGGLEGFVGLLDGGVTVEVEKGKLLLHSLSGVTTWTADGDARSGRFLADAGAGKLAFKIVDGRAVSFQDQSGASLMQRTSIWFEPSVLLTFAVLTAVASAATIAGVALRNRREFRENNLQSRASIIQNTQAVLWLTAIGFFLIWAAGTGDTAAVVFSWPGPWLVIGSACALVSGFLTLATLIFTPAIWQGGRRVDSWSALRKTFFTMSVLIYTGFTILLGMWGAIWPWSG